MRIEQDANIREKTSKSSKVLKVIKGGDIISGEYSDTSEEWFKVSFDERTGFIYSSLVAIELVDFDEPYTADTSKTHVEKGDGFDIIGTVMGKMASFCECHSMWSVIIAIVFIIVGLLIAIGLSNVVVL